MAEKSWAGFEGPIRICPLTDCMPQLILWTTSAGSIAGTQGIYKSPKMQMDLYDARSACVGTHVGPPHRKML